MYPLPRIIAHDTRPNNPPPYNLCWHQWVAIGHTGHPSSHTLPRGRWAATLPPSVGRSVWGCRRMHTAPHRPLCKGGRNHEKVKRLYQKQRMIMVLLPWLTCNKSPILHNMLKAHAKMEKQPSRHFLLLFFLFFYYSFMKGPPPLNKS